MIQFFATKMREENIDIKTTIEESDYKYGFTSDIETEFIPKGLNEGVIRLISEKKEEPEWMLELRLKAYRHWLTLKHPTWGHLDIPEIDFNDIIYFAAPKKKKQLSSMDEVDPSALICFDMAQKLSASRSIAPMRLSMRI